MKVVLELEVTPPTDGGPFGIPDLANALLGRLDGQLAFNDAATDAPRFCTLRLDVVKNAAETAVFNGPGEKSSENDARGARAQDSVRLDCLIRILKGGRMLRALPPETFDRARIDKWMENEQISKAHENQIHEQIAEISDLYHRRGWDSTFVVNQLKRQQAVGNPIAKGLDL